MRKTRLENGPLMFQDAFSKLDPEDSKAALQDINPHLQEITLDPANATLLTCGLSFYPGYSFIDAADYTVVPTARRYLVYKPGHAVVLNWTGEPVFQLNKAVPVLLTAETVADYVRFYCRYVRGRHGRFIIVETVNDIPWQEDPPQAARKAVGAMIQPVKIIGTDKDGTFHLFVCLVYKTALFRATIMVAPDGTVTMQDEELLVEDMPVSDETFE